MVKMATPSLYFASAEAPAEAATAEACAESSTLLFLNRSSCSAFSKKITFRLIFLPTYSFSKIFQPTFQGFML